MSTLKSPRTIKFVLPLLALVFTISIAFAFTSTKQQPAAKPTATTILHFKYTPPSTNDYSSASVQAQSNWNQISAGQACEQQKDQRACSFSIEVPDNEQSDYLDASGHPAGRVDILVGGTSNAYVTGLNDNVTSSSLTKSIENVEIP